MNNFCIAHASFLHRKYLRDSNKNLEHLFGGNLYRIFLVFSPSVGEKHFWVETYMDGMFLRQPLV
jgi:hypothetical protein